MAKKRELTMGSKVNNRLVRAVVDVHMNEADFNDIIFLHSILCQCFLPYSKPIIRNGRHAVRDKDGNSLEKMSWEVSNGKASLLISSGRIFDPVTGKFGRNAGLPYGSKARLILAYINKQALLKSSPKIDVGESMTEFIRLCNIDTDGKSLKWAKDQLQRISAASIQLGWSQDERPKQANLNIVEVFEPWFPESPDQKILWDSELTLSQRYFENLVNHAIPLDQRALLALSHNAMAMDIYAWMAQRLHRIQKFTFFTWKLLKSQFGTEYSRLADFRRDFKAALKAVRGVYQDAKFEVNDRTGVRFYQSPSPIASKTFQQIPGSK